MKITDRFTCSNPDCGASLSVKEWLLDLAGYNGTEALQDADRVREGKGCKECHFGFGLDVDLPEARLRADRDVSCYPYREKKEERDGAVTHLFNTLDARAYYARTHQQILLERKETPAHV